MARLVSPIPCNNVLSYVSSAGIPELADVAPLASAIGETVSEAEDALRVCVYR